MIRRRPPNGIQNLPSYKANRQEAPEDLLAAIPDIKRIIRGFNIPVLEVDGFEADDVIGTLSKKGAAAGYLVYMVTPDKDYGQLVDGNIKIYKPGYQGGDAEILGAKEVCEKWNIKEVHQVIDILGLMGDAVDNIPVLPVWVRKQQQNYSTEYGTLENVLENADKIKGALGEKVRNGRNAAILSKKLATIITDVPIEFHEEDFKLKEWNKDLLKEVFTELEFKTVAKRILGEDITISSGCSATRAFKPICLANAVESGKSKPEAKAAKQNKQKEQAIQIGLPDGDIMHAGKNIHNTRTSIPHHTGRSRPLRTS